jgi:hypothetical protein
MPCADEGDGRVTNQTCCERREAMKSEQMARAESIKLATKMSDSALIFLRKDIDKLDTRINALILLAVSQLLALVVALTIIIITR